MRSKSRPCNALLASSHHFQLGPGRCRYQEHMKYQFDFDVHLFMKQLNMQVSSKGMSGSCCLGPTLHEGPPRAGAREHVAKDRCEKGKEMALFLLQLRAQKQATWLCFGPDRCASRCASPRDRDGDAVWPKKQPNTPDVLARPGNGNLWGHISGTTWPIEMVHLSKSAEFNEESSQNISNTVCQKVTAIRDSSLKQKQC